MVWRGREFCKAPLTALSLSDLADFINMLGHGAFSGAPS
jgi:hypothetical protein